MYEGKHLRPGRISDDEKFDILMQLGNIARDKYDEFVVEGGNARGYNLVKLQGSLDFEPDIHTFENRYFVRGKDEEWTKIAEYFE